MTNYAKRVRAGLSQNWFYPVVMILAGLAWASSRLVPGEELGGSPISYEGAVLTDVLITLPLLFWLCFRKRLPVGRMAVGLVATVCGGLWLATWLVPADQQRLLIDFGWIRYVGLAFLVVIELKLLVAGLRLIWKPGARAMDLEREGIPPLIARLMLLEAKFWRWLWSCIKR